MIFNDPDKYLKLKDAWSRVDRMVGGLQIKEGGNLLSMDSLVFNEFVAKPELFDGVNEINVGEMTISFVKHAKLLLNIRFEIVKLNALFTLAGSPLQYLHGHIRALHYRINLESKEIPRNTSHLSGLEIDEVFIYVLSDVIDEIIGLRTSEEVRGFLNEIGLPTSIPRIFINSYRTDMVLTHFPRQDAYEVTYRGGYDIPNNYMIFPKDYSEFPFAK